MSLPPAPPRRSFPKTLRWGVVAVATAGVAVVLTLLACGPKPPPEIPHIGESDPDPILKGPDFFTDATAAAGIDFSYRNGEEAMHLAILESLGGGVAAFDYDGDGLLDLFLPGGGYYDGPDKKTILGHPCRLYRNAGGMKFTDATDAAGLDKLADGKDWFYTHAAAAGDYDRDGWPDLLVTGWRRVALFHNEPDGKGGRKFVDVTAKAGLAQGITWATSAGWADFDGDGFPDLFVCQYVDWSFDNHPKCNYDTPKEDVCPPKKFNGLQSKVYLNNGNGTFADQTEAAGIKKGEAQASKALGVVLVDVNGDGKAEAYVANDTVPKYLYVNKSEKGKITFAEKGMLAGVALDGGGAPNGSMGVDAGDPEGTGKPALWVTNYENEYHALYRNNSAGDAVKFLFATQGSGIGVIGQKFVGWGTGFNDFDLDGWEDIFIANGHAIRYPSKADRLQKPVLFLNRGSGKFTDITVRGGPYCQQPHLSRGAAFADFDNDGRIDVAICNTNDKVALLHNTLPTGDNTWVGIDLVGEGYRDVVGARVMVEAGGRTQTRFAKGGGSYASTPDRRFVVGLGDKGKVTKLTVVWPDGSKQEWADVPANKYHVIEQGKKELQTARPRK